MSLARRMGTLGSRRVWRIAPALLVPAVGLVVALAAAARAQDGDPAEAAGGAAEGTETAGDPGAAPEGATDERATADDAAAEDTAGGDTEPGADGPEVVHVGLYLHHVPELDLRSNSYLADFYLWFRWRGEIDPTETFEFTNLVDGWDVMRDVLYTDDDGNPQPEELPDGSRYQVIHVQGRFGHPFDVRDYPFDAQEVVILVEEAEYTPDELVYEVDQGTQEVHPALVIPGWELHEVHASVQDVVYPTNFGDTRRTPGADSYTQLRYALRVARPVWGNLVMTILPIAIVMLITFVMFGVESKYFEGRLGLGITSLISAVALQLTAAGDLPSTGYLVLLDHVYNVSYVVIFLSLLESVVAVRLYDAGKTEASQRLDWAMLVAMSLLFFGGITLIIVLR